MKSRSQSEVRTVRSITDKLPEDLRSKAKEVFDAVQSNWKSFLSKDNALRQSRSDLAAALVNARKLLEEAGKKKLSIAFSRPSLFRDRLRIANASECPRGGPN